MGKSHKHPHPFPSSKRVQSSIPVQCKAKHDKTNYKINSIINTSTSGEPTPTQTRATRISRNWQQNKHITIIKRTKYIVAWDNVQNHIVKPVCYSHTGTSQGWRYRQVEGRVDFTVYKDKSDNYSSVEPETWYTIWTNWDCDPGKCRHWVVVMVWPRGWISQRATIKLHKRFPIYVP